MASGSRGSSRIKKLAKQIPDEREMRKLLLALEMENTQLADYALAMLGASLVSVALEAGIKSRFIQLTPDESNRLFSYESRGPIADLLRK